jgi:hypothetical protein
VVLKEEIEGKVRQGQDGMGKSSEGRTMGWVKAARGGLVEAGGW